MIQQIELLAARTSRWVSLLQETRSLSTTLAVMRRHRSEPVLSAIRRGAVLKRNGPNLDVSYRGTTISIPARATYAVRPFTDLLDAGYVLARRDVDNWLLTIPGGPSFIFDDASLASDLYVIHERFVTQEYDFLDVRGKDVIDIGVNIGDSAVYFSLSGAAQVYAFEPFSHVFCRAQANVTLNRLEDRIRLFNVGIGGRDESKDILLHVGNSMGFSTGGTQVIPVPAKNSFTENVRLITLAHALRLCDIQEDHRVVCKVDCEGAEFDIFSSGPDTLAALTCIEELAIEYHWKSPNPIIEVLEAAQFKVVAMPTDEAFGLIWARR